MAPPNFNDIGKKFKDLYTKQFPSGFLKCLVKLPMTNGISINLDGSHKIGSNAFTSNIETKAPLKIANMEVMWTEKWTNKNELSTNFDVNVTKDLSNGLEILYEPSNGALSFKSKNAYKSDQLTASGDLKFKTYMPEVSLSFMTGLYQSMNLNGGGTITYDSSKKKFTNMGYGIQIDKGSLCMSAIVMNHSDFGSQLYLKLTDQWDVGLETGWNQESKKSRFAGVSQLKIGQDSLIKSKLASCGTFCFGYSFLATEGIRLTVGMGLNTRSLTSGSHELGIQVEL